MLLILWLVVAGLAGLRRGFTGQIVGLIGFALGALLGARIAPHLLSGGNLSPWQPMAALGGAIVGGLLGQLAFAPVAGLLRGRIGGRLVSIDRAGGAVAGAVMGLAAAWILAVAALHQPALGMRQTVQRSALLPTLVDVMPEEQVLSALQGFDRLPVVVGVNERDLPAPDTSLPTRPAIRSALSRVVRIEGSACGLRIQGSGWVVGDGLVATNAHVVAGEDDTVVQIGDRELAADPVYVSSGNDVALLRVADLGLTPLPIREEPHEGVRVALVGYPNGTTEVTRFAGSAGRPVAVLAPDVRGRGIDARPVIPVRGRVAHGMSGGPVLDARGRVLAMLFAAADDRPGGYAVPVSQVTGALDDLSAAADTGPCVS